MGLDINSATINANGTTLEITNNSKKAFTLDSTGRALSPFQPRCYAWGTTGATYDGYQNGTNILKYENTDFNVGNIYDPSTGRYTAPRTGYYLFVQGGNMSNPGAGTIYNWWQRSDGQNWQAHYDSTSQGNGGGWRNIHHAFTVYLTAGQYMTYIKFGSNFHMDNVRWSNISVTFLS
jgi:hypothetical protein